MKLIVIFGPPAVGKMTVAHELARTTGLKVFHNHMAIDVTRQFFDYGTPEFKELTPRLRMTVMEAVAKSGLEGMIFTYVWAFEQYEDKQHIAEYVAIFEERGADIYYVELQADQKTRLARNRTEHRLKHKPDKRDLENSDKNLKDADEKYVLKSSEGFFDGKNYLYLDTEALSAEEVAVRIKDFFNL